MPSVLPAKYKYSLPSWKKEACTLPALKNENSHYICNDKGEPKCLPGWQGDLCDQPICRKGCDPMTGYCNEPGECKCKMGYDGPKCNKCITLPGCVHGTCNTPFQCVCKQGWDGLFCSDPICRADCPSTRGYCHSPGECRCRFGWTGPTCRECMPLPGCQNGYCDRPLECNCLPGYVGLLCTTPLCAPGCHSERGYCRSPGECRCKVGWKGANCTECHSYPGCVHGSCNQPWECNCEPGWGGMLCDEELNYCEKNPGSCKNGGECKSLEAKQGHFKCSCPPGITGKNCEIVPEITTTTVEPCPSGTSGRNCENLIESTEAETDVPSTTAKEEEADSSVASSSEITNTDEPVAEVNFCEKNKNACKNGGKCMAAETADGYKCQCPSGFTGKNCESQSENGTLTVELNTVALGGEGVKIRKPVTLGLSKRIAGHKDRHSDGFFNYFRRRFIFPISK